MPGQRRGGRLAAAAKGGGRCSRGGAVASDPPAKRRFVAGGVEDAREEGAGDIEDSTRPSATSSAVPRMLELLTASQLSATYGKGFELMKRMGFSPDSGLGLRADALAAPLKAHDQGRSRRGLQGASEVPQPPPSVARRAGRPTDDLLAEVLAAMRKVGDEAAAEELLRLATGVRLHGDVDDNDVPTGAGRPCTGAAPRRRGMGGSRAVVPGLEASSSCGGSDSEASSGSAPPRPRPGEDRAVAIVLKRMTSDGVFPVLLEEQARALMWKGRFAAALGSYEEFLQRRCDAFRIVRCPGDGRGGGSTGALVLPAEGRGGGISTGKYSMWVQRQRAAAGGKAKNKWRHVERVVVRMCCAFESEPGVAVAQDCLAEVGVVVSAVLAPGDGSRAAAGDEGGSSGSEGALDWSEDVAGDAPVARVKR